MARKGLNTDCIVDAAAGLIAEKGFDQFSLRELADRLSVKTASLYNHINSLSELTSNIGQFVFERMAGQLYSGTEDASSFDALYNVAIEYRKFAKENPELCKTIVKIPSTGSPDLIEKGKALHTAYILYWKPAVYQKRTSFILAGQDAVPCMDLLRWRKRAFLQLR